MSVITIVIAWAEKTKLAPTGRVVMRDLNYFPEFALDWEGKAAIWLNEGTIADLGKAKAYADKHGYQVFDFPVTEAKPLEKARVKAVEMIKENKL